MSGKSLFDNAISFSPVLAKAFGACGALLIQQIHYHCAGKNNFWLGNYWVYNTAKDWADRLMLWDERTIRRTLSSLRSDGVVLVGVNNHHGYDKTLWYRIDYDVLCSELGKRIPMWTFCPNGCGQNVRIDVAKMSAPIPKKETTKTTSKISSEKPNLNDGKEVAMLPKNSNKKGPTSTAMVLVQKLAMGSSKTTPAMGMYKVWASSIPKHHPEIKFIGAFTVVQKAMIGRLATGWGSSAEKALAYVVEHWVSFGKFLKEVSGLKSVPQVPVLEFLVKHSSMAMNFYLKQNSVQLSATTVPEKTVGSVVLSGKVKIKKAIAPVPVAPSPKPIIKAVEEVEVSLAEVLSFDPSES